MLNETIEKFYLELLDYAGIKVEDNIFVNKNEKIGDITIDGNHLSLPYLDNLRKPEGKVIFHLLNENFISPENATFNLFKKRLTLELNIRLSSLFISLISVASDVQLQQRIKSSKLIDMIANMGEMDHTLIENFMNVIKASKKVNDEGFMFDIYLKKNGDINNQPYAAIGKLNFHLYNEINKAIDEKDREFKVYGCKLRKKDLLALRAIFNVIFENIDNKEAYVEGTDNKIFRYLNILIKTAYLISAQVNTVADCLEEINEPSLELDTIRSNHNWINYLEDLYNMSVEIRTIPNQTDIVTESKRLKLDESKAAAVQQQTPAVMERQTPSFVPPQQQQPQQPVQTTQQPQQPLSAEEIVRNYGRIPQQYPQQPIYQQPMYPPQMSQPVGQPLPMWMQQKMMAEGGYQGQQGHPMMPPQQMMQSPMYPQQPMYQQPMYPQQPMYQQPMYPGQMMPNDQGGLQINPHFINR